MPSQEDLDSVNEVTGFHCTSHDSVEKIIRNGFDERLSSKGFYGAGIYFSTTAQKADQFAFGYSKQKCPAHDIEFCKICERNILICRINLGKSMKACRPWVDDRTIETQWGPVVRYNKNCSWQNRYHGHPPPKYNSVSGVDKDDAKVYAIYRGNQVYPKYVVRYRHKK